VPQSKYAFISFASADAELAHRAVDSLERAGVHCWIADRDITMGASYPAAITAAIRGSDAFLLLLSETANGSPHVLREVELAFTTRRPILPVCIAGVKPSADLQYFLSTSQWLDAGNRFDQDDLAKIAPVLRQLLERGRFSGDLTGRSRRWVRVAAAAALVAAVLAAGIIWFRNRLAPTTPAAVSAVTATSPTPKGPETAPASATTPAAPPASGAATTARPAVKINPRDGQTYVWIAPGRFVMGCSPGDPGCDDDEKPPHAVEITRGYWLARTEVTVAQFRKASPGRAATTGETGDVPITGVDWSEAKAYCTRVGGRLPTEAEWEYAARAGEQSRYYGNLSAVAWFDDNSDGRPHPVATKTPNAFGLHDMLGNVSEWVLDRYYNAYDDSSDPLTPDQPLAGNASGVARGGSWISEAKSARVSRRLSMPPDAQEPHIGFRCAVNRL
jgi:formylglycine-generating enzyme required for sulfatase activity